jgi:SAM-dependent methyltransferase
MSDPIGAILTWCRVLKPGGLLYLVLPDKRVTFDRARVRTTLEHMLLDHQRPSAERDFDHYLDYAVHVHRASGQPAIDEADRLLREGISIHYHVFLPSDVVGLVDWIAAHRQPLRLLEGPAWTRGGDEFHLLLELS